MKKLLGSYLATTISSWTIAFLIPLYVLEITGSAFWTSLAYFAAMAPYILVTPFAGVWSDRYSKRLFLIGGDLVSAVLAVIIYGSLSCFSGEALAATLIFLGFLFASVSATHHPMFQSIAPEILQVAELTLFNAIVNAIDNIVGIAAPLIVAFFLVIANKDAVLLACVLGFVVSFPLILLLQETSTGEATKGNVISELMEGVRYVISDKNLTSFSLLFFCVNFGLALVDSNLVFILSSSLQVPQQDLGYYFGIIGCGAVLGSFAASRLVGKVSDTRSIITCCFCAGVLALAIAFLKTPLAIAVAWALSTAFQSIVVVTFFTFRQRVVPKAILGRAVGVTRLIAYLAIPPASILGGWLLDHGHGLGVVMTLAGTAIILGSAIALRTPAMRSKKPALSS